MLAVTEYPEYMTNLKHKVWEKWQSCQSGNGTLRETERQGDRERDKYWIRRPETSFVGFEKLYNNSRNSTENI